MRKMPLETQAKKFLLEVPLIERRGALNHAFSSNPDSKARMALCCAAYDLGFKEFATHRVSKVFGVDELYDHAKKVSGLVGEVEAVFEFTTLPLTAGGKLHPRPGRIIKICFSDGKSVYCKNRNAEQEVLGFNLSQTLQLSAPHSSIAGSWVITEGLAGLSLGDLYTFSEHFSISITDPNSLYQKVLEIVAFDYVFGMLDRNEKSIFLDNCDPQTPKIIDHEYLLFHYPIPLVGKQFLNYRLYLREFGLPDDLVKSDSAIYQNLDLVRLFFDRANAQLHTVLGMLESHIRQKPYVILAGSDVLNLDLETSEKCRRKILAGPEEFADVLMDQMAEIRRSGMFQMP